MDLNNSAEDGKVAIPTVSSTVHEHASASGQDAPVSLSEAARDPRDEAPITPPISVSRPASPYTMNPPIDFDGLSWPSEFVPLHAQSKLTSLTL